MLELHNHLAMFHVSTNEYQLFLHERGLPAMVKEYAIRASLSEHFESDEDDADWCFVAVSRAASDWPFLTVTQRFSPATCGFHPGVILVPETDILFIGAGTRLLAFDLAKVTRIWVDNADTGFWGWARHENVILMSAELEFAAWDIHGNKLWSTFVEPPWSYSIVNTTVNLDIMGSRSSFALSSGPTAK